jgi:hypothetical protein
MVAHHGRGHAQIRGNADFAGIVFHCKASGLGCIVGNGKGAENKIVYDKPGAAGKRAKRVNAAKISGCGLSGAIIDVNRQIVAPGQHTHAGYMIVVLMGNHQGVEVSGTDALLLHPALDLHPGKAGVN